MSNQKALSKLCYCQSARHARAVVKALLSAGFVAYSSREGQIYVDDPSDAALAIAKAVK